MTIDWKAIRTLGGKQAAGFEELCSQLARSEQPADAEFKRKGTPDAGVECFSVLRDGTEWGWQAKYFDSLSDSQWSQLDKSVKQAIEKHPALVRYFVCVPLDRADGRVDGKKSAMERWGDRESKWKEWARAKGREIEFIWWGSSELLDRLSRIEHIGRVHFWFDSRVFDDAWFAEKRDEAIVAAGPRYTPEVHVSLPVAEEIELFGRSTDAIDRIKTLARGLRKTLGIAGGSSGTEADPSRDLPMAAVREAVELALAGFSEIDARPAGEIQFAALSERLSAAMRSVEQFAELLLQHSREYREQESTGSADRWRNDNPYDRRLDRIYRLESELREARTAVDHANGVCNSNLLILSGDAGTGKTHLLCDVTRKRGACGAPTLLLMGHRFVSFEPPWVQAAQQLDLGGIAAEEFVGALEAAAQAASCRALLLIDAINEGQGRLIWPAHLAAFLALVNRSPWIGVLLSVRSSYEEVVVPEQVLEDAIRVRHHGFEDHEYDATRVFFSYYGLELPSTPIQQPEFTNPLFLKTVCRGLREDGARRLPRGFHGITAAFDLYLRAINNSLSKSLGYNPSDQLVRDAMERFAHLLSASGERWLPRKTVDAEINELLPGREFERSLYRGLVSEGVVVEEVARDEGGSRKEIAFISYERFADHIIAKLLIETHVNESEPEAAFAEGGGLSFICDESVYTPTGVIEALCIQLPERHGKELVELAPRVSDRWDVGDAFRQSLIWRRQDAFFASSHEVLNSLLRSKQDWDDTVEALLTVSTLPDHPYNAEFLDARLRLDSMPVRDAWWSTYLHERTGSRGVVDRLVDWGLDVTVNTILDGRADELCAISLVWMLSTPNRFLRDRATKAVVCLLTGRPETMSLIVRRFADVDDPYVAERLYAIAYGVAMKSTDPHEVRQISEAVYESVFADDNVPVHILLRDYARGVIERALHLGSDITVDEELFRPPYKSLWPDVPDEEEIKPYLADWDRGSYDSADTEWAWSRIASSVMSDDFSRYVIGLNSYTTNWLSLTLDEPRWRSSESRIAELLPALSEAAQSAWKRCLAAEEVVSADALSQRFHRARARSARASSETGSGSADAESGTGVEPKESVNEQALNQSREDFLVLLVPGQIEEAADILAQRVFLSREQPPRFDLEMVQRYVLWRVHDLGWTVDRFGHFDRFTIRASGREASKPERMGKKYQWIAYHEFLASICDHYQYLEQYREEGGDQSFEGAWQSSIRDIDPSSTMTSKPGGTGWVAHEPSWWARESYADWTPDEPTKSWLAREDDLPKISELLITEDEDGQNRWVNLHSHLNWCQPHPAEVDAFDVDRRDIWFILMGYLMRDEDVDAFMDWTRGVDFMGRWMPDPPERYGMFTGEYGWSPAFRYFNRPYYGMSEWVVPERDCPVSIRTASISCSCRCSDFDCSMDSSFDLQFLASDISERLNLKWSGRAADLVDSNSNLAAFDPTAHGTGPTGLLMREDLVKQYLSDEGLGLCWTVLGEKQVLSGGDDREFQGALSISGAYSLRNDATDGFLITRRDRIPD